MIKHLSNFIPIILEEHSGKVFYSGRTAFSKPSQLYILGINPGGSPDFHKNSTIKTHTKQVLEEKPDLWSEYADESWEEKPAGSFRMQPRILHMLDKLSLEASNTPASNLIFVRSARQSDIKDQFDILANQCWTFHEEVIRTLGVKVVLCLGKSVGNFVCRRLNATDQVNQFIEDNNRKWVSRSFINREGIAVITATHPSIANWKSVKTDPSHIVLQALSKSV